MKPEPSPLNERPEDELFARWSKAEPSQDKDQLFADLISELRRHAFAVCWIQLHDSRPDIVNNAVYRALQSIQSFRGDSKFSTWFQTIVQNLCMSEGRTLSLEPATTSIEDLHEELASFDAMEARIELQEIRELLNERDQELLDLKLSGLSETEIAKQLGVSRNNVHWRWGELRKRVLRNNTRVRKN